ncbi:MAG: hypothetical protein SGPRY_000880 [Prymnesium sp.]
MAQCRFCLAEESASELVEPCACIGSSRLVHLHCLRNWQRHQLRATCEVCRAPWKFPLDQVERNSWLRSLKTNPHYRSMQPGALSLASEQNLRERMRPGTLILQTPAQAAEVTPILRPILDPSHTEVIAILASALQSRTSHWFKGAFLIIYTSAGDASDGSDSICAVNLVQPMQASADPIISDLKEAFGTIPLGVINGGPCNRAQPLCLLEIEGTGVELTRIPGWRGDALKLEGLASDGCELWLMEVDVAKEAAAKLAACALAVRTLLLVRGCAICNTRSEVQSGRPNAVSIARVAMAQLSAFLIT